MKFTYFCESGRNLSPRTHFLYIGEWIRPKGFIILQHGNISYLEYKKLTGQGFVRIFENRGADYTYIETIMNRPDLQEYRDNQRRRVGVLTLKRYNLYAGRVWIYGREIK